MEPTDLSVEKIVEMAVMAGRMAAERAPADAYKATERRLYALPILREKQKWDRERLPKLEGAARADLEVAMAADAYEIETLERALVNCARDAYYQTVTGRYFERLDDEQLPDIYEEKGASHERQRPNEYHSGTDVFPCAVKRVEPDRVRGPDDLRE